ncbi:hypothetical protein F5J12DRAFT_913858 [Pisolithus orientalis]|uniref:uncharacterized protein n=1 Tax=Pisolithus orientalis TaxID=936130 RepID=UPI0022256388|nr:uncharacterized protein F5J12DRAFT_913858 [Pisolithus orientalis]KAI6002650.1 hypothetical protein F5J12DRAFT_913858 [Pisolithus orientalis]
MLSKISADLTFYSTLSLLFAPEIQVQNQAQAHLGLVLCERLINMPVEIFPPMYCMLVDELQDAVADGDPYHFAHSRAYRLMPEEEEAMAAAKKDLTQYKSSESSQLGRVRNSQIFADFRALAGRCLLTRKLPDADESPNETTVSKFVRGLASIVVSQLAVPCWKLSGGHGPRDLASPSPSQSNLISKLGHLEKRDLQLKTDR